MTTDAPEVVTLGPLMADLTRALAEKYGAVPAEQVAEGTKEVRVVVTTGRTGVRAAMDRFPCLAAIVHFGVGYDTTDAAAAWRRGIAVSNTPDVLTDCVADTAVGLVLDVMRGLSAADRFVRSGDWARGSFPLARKVTGSKVGILGLGRIGSAVARRLAAFDARISYHSRTPKPGVAWPYFDSVSGLASAVDVLVVTAAGGEGSRHLVDADVLAALGPVGFLVNVARGSVVDEDALVAALEADRIAGAGLDVFADEPHVPRALLDREDVVLLPHLASGTTETRADMRDLVLSNVEHFLAEGTLLTPVED
ncbi:MAG: 2-hydroxyacid dehydrogenase [Actinophytocola sp.]|nr:2-hydroxyacid dehydrogenase [Actinophytocola sp.]